MFAGRATTDWNGEVVRAAVIQAATDKTLTIWSWRNDMKRRTCLAALATAFAIPIGGCSTSSEPEIETAQRLGAAPAVSLSEPVRLEYDDGTDRSFAEQATNLAVDAAASRVERILEENALTGEGISVGWGRVDLADITVTDSEQPTEDEFTRATNRGPIVHHRHHYARDGELISEPAVSFDDVVDGTPRSVSVTVTDTNRKYVATVPVMCDRGWIQNE